MAVTDAPGSTAPDMSFTTPAIWAVLNWPHEMGAISRNVKDNRRTFQVRTPLLWQRVQLNVRVNKCREASEWNSRPKLGGVAAPRKEKSRSYLGRAQTGWFRSRNAITGGFRPRNHPGAADKT